MTVCAVVILQHAVVAIADGRLVSGEVKSFDTSVKIVPFQARYKVPIISMNRFSHFDQVSGERWYIMFSGTYALCKETIDLFKTTVGEFYLSRDYENGATGTPKLTGSFDRSDGFMDDYNFGRDELPILDRLLVKDEFRKCLQQKADEWLSNGKELDCQFILFGAREKGDDDQPNETYLAFRVTAERDPSLINRARISIDAAPYCMPIAIGDPSAVGQISFDPELLSRIKASIPAPGRWSDLDASSTGGVTSRLVELVRTMELDSVGGEILVASGQNGSTPKLIQK